MCRRRLILALVVTTGVGALLAGCGGSAAPADPGAGTSAPSDSAGGTDAVGEWRSGADQPAWLVIEADGTVSGSDGCNNLAGTAALGGTEIVFDPGVMTLMACPGVTVSFAGLSTGTVDGDVLTTYDDAGTEIVRLTRVEE